MTAGVLRDPVLASQARAEVDQDLARVVRAAEAVDPAMTVGQDLALMTENGRPLGQVLESRARAEVDQASRARVEEDRALVNQVSPRLYCFNN